MSKMLRLPLTDAILQVYVPNADSANPVPLVGFDLREPSHTSDIPP
ncbi:MAG: hypothetical protein ISR77_12490 [Pirellulaceae bacterium]|nr:hypothetical protein [Pirellulaceae bacterium]